MNNCGLHRILVQVLAVLITGTLAPALAPVYAADCSAEAVAKAVDTSGEQLRSFNIEMQPKLQERMRRYAEAKKLPKDGFEDAVLDALQDAKLSSFDSRSGDLLSKIDELGRTGDGNPVTCARVQDIKASGAALLAIMREKSDYMIATLDRGIAEASGTPSASAKKATDSSADKSALKVKEAQGGSQWTTAAKPNDAYQPPPVGPTSIEPATSAIIANSDGYTIDEIREATRGFFGTVSTSLASVIEHAFKTSGRPTAYVLGTEGGGAFLAGLRYGKGKLYLRSGPATQDVYWHGPSLGTDFGASGSQTMFLIYRLKDRDGLFRSFSGVDGSAFIVGGVGVTLLKGGDVIMAPIRSGLGLRVGANIGYLRFTDHPTWNPF